MSDTHAALVEAMARAIESAPKSKQARAALAALRTARPDIAALLDNEAVAVPRDADEVAIYQARDAYRATSKSGVCAMSLDAQFRNEFARELAFYRAMLAASPWSKRDE